MAITASGLYCLTFKDILGNDTAIDVLADTIKAALINNTHTPNFDTDTGWNSTNEVGTPSGGVALTSPTLTVSSGSLVFDAADTAWGSQTMSGIRACRIYDATITTPTASPMLCLVNFGSDYSVSSGVLTIQWAAGGIFSVDLTP
jgi:hypothetical protein